MASQVAKTFLKAHGTTAKFGNFNFFLNKMCYFINFTYITCK